MQPRDFCFWLQGFSELTPQAPSQEQWDLIREHLSTVFTKVTPELGFKSKEELGVNTLPKTEAFDPRGGRIC